jgi:DME family drug/metabolite transporter
VGAARIVFGGLMLVLVARGLRVRMPNVSRGLIGMACAVALYQLSFFAAVRLTGVAVGTVVAIGTGPAAAALLVLAGLLVLAAHGRRGYVPAKATA